MVKETTSLKIAIHPVPTLSEDESMDVDELEEFMPEFAFPTDNDALNDLMDIVNEELDPNSSFECNDLGNF